MKRSVFVSLGRFARDVLTREEANGDTHASTSAARAISCYLNDKGSGSLAWPFPSFLRDREPSDAVELQLSIDDSLWRSLEEEAESQEISVRQMLEHAVFYFAAEVNAGRATRRILEDFDGEAGSETGCR